MNNNIFSSVLNLLPSNLCINLVCFLLLSCADTLYNPSIYILRWSTNQQKNIIELSQVAFLMLFSFIICLAVKGMESSVSMAYAPFSQIIIYYSHTYTHTQNSSTCTHEISLFQSLLLSCEVMHAKLILVCALKHTHTHTQLTLCISHVFTHSLCLDSSLSDFIKHSLHKRASTNTPTWARSLLYL